ncbi:MAG: hypothetical protein SFU98_15850 [Leptospiraceae bacterium]|nr:hypothetical protein [Leptospiraceae bacterium]
MAFGINILNHTYYHPGVQNANSGDNYYLRSAGYDSSVLPQPGRSYVISVTFTF